MTVIESRVLSAETVRGMSRAAVVAGGACWAVGVVQYAVAQIVAAAAWTRPYSLKNNYISDLATPRPPARPDPARLPRQLGSPTSRSRPIPAVPAP